MERVCKNCTHFNPDTSICDFKDLIKLENDWCWGFLEEEKENKMTVLDINKDQLRLLTDYELESIIETVSKEIDNRTIARRENLKEAFFKAWKDLEEDGATIFCKESYMLEKVNLNDLEIE